MAACDQCYRSKIRCSGHRPTCEKCSERDSFCTYTTSRPVGRPKGRKHIKTAELPLREFDIPFPTSRRDLCGQSPSNTIADAFGVHSAETNTSSSNQGLSPSSFDGVSSSTNWMLAPSQTINLDYRSDICSFNSPMGSPSTESLELSFHHSLEQLELFCTDAHPTCTSAGVQRSVGALCDTIQKDLHNSVDSRTSQINLQMSPFHHSWPRSIELITNLAIMRQNMLGHSFDFNLSLAREGLDLVSSFISLHPGATPNPTAAIALLTVCKIVLRLTVECFRTLNSQVAEKGSIEQQLRIDGSLPEPSKGVMLGTYEIRNPESQRRVFQGLLTAEEARAMEISNELKSITNSLSQRTADSSPELWQVLLDLLGENPRSDTPRNH